MDVHPGFIPLEVPLLGQFYTFSRLIFPARTLLRTNSLTCPALHKIATNYCKLYASGGIMVLLLVLDKIKGSQNKKGLNLA